MTTRTGRDDLSSPWQAIDSAVMDQPHPEEDRLLEAWRLTQAQLQRVSKETQADAWQLAAADEWRAQMAYQEAVGERLRLGQVEDVARRRLKAAKARR